MFHERIKWRECFSEIRKGTFPLAINWALIDWLKPERWKQNARVIWSKPQTANK